MRVPAAGAQKETITTLLPNNRVITPPSEILFHEFMKPLGLSVDTLALALRVPAKHVMAITAQKRLPLIWRCG